MSQKPYMSLDDFVSAAAAATANEEKKDSTELTFKRDGASVVVPLPANLSKFTAQGAKEALEQTARVVVRLNTKFNDNIDGTEKTLRGKRLSPGELAARFALPGLYGAPAPELPAPIEARVNGEAPAVKAKSK